MHKIKSDFLLLLICFMSFKLFDQLKEPRGEEGNFLLPDTSEGPCQDVNPGLLPFALVLLLDL